MLRELLDRRQMAAVSAQRGVVKDFNGKDSESMTDCLVVPLALLDAVQSAGVRKAGRRLQVIPYSAARYHLLVQARND